MGIFGRRKQTPDQEPEEELEETPEAEPGEPGVDRAWDRSTDGPWDISESSGEQLVDLGALKVPASKRMELRLDLEKGSGRAVGATLGWQTSHLQVQAFAAPRSGGLWQEIRREIADGITQNGGTAEVADGILGRELRCRMPSKTSDGRTAYQPARFLGIDGPRWFLRCVVHGPAAADQGAYQAMTKVIRMMVVDRGDEPRPPREVLALQPPAAMVEAMQERATKQREASDAGAEHPVASSPENAESPEQRPLPGQGGPETR